MATRLNIGCGRSPTPDWINYDNSPSVWMARWPMLTALAARLGLIDQHALAFVAFCRCLDRIGVRDFVLIEPTQV